jgi:hypothetical protein
VLPRYERIAFEKSFITPPGETPAAFVCPGHSLLDAVIDLTLERDRDLLRRGAVLVDERDSGTAPRVLFYLEHAIQDASVTRSGERRVISKRLLYVEIHSAGQTRHLQYAPYLDYRPLKEDEPGLDAILERAEASWVTKELERSALAHAIEHAVPQHLAEVRGQRVDLVDKTQAQVHDRLKKEINYWDLRAQQLRDQETAGKGHSKLNSADVAGHRQRVEAARARPPGLLRTAAFPR